MGFSFRARFNEDKEFGDEKGKCFV